MEIIPKSNVEVAVHDRKAAPFRQRDAGEAGGSVLGLAGGGVREEAVDVADVAGEH